jgi:tetratricopeptide (TPR) repeat protein
VFNEYLQVSMAWGVPALCGILMLVAVLFSLGHKSGQYGVCGALLSLSVFAFASYPFQFLAFILAFIALLVACAMGYRKVWVQVMALVLGIGLGIYAVGHRPAKDARRMFKEAHALHKSGQWEASTELLKETMKVSSDAMVLNIIGKNCQAQGQPKEAEHWFIRSTRRLPNRIYPYYLLAKLYAEHPEMFPKEKLEWAVRMVQEKEAKVESTAIREMREEVKELLKDKRE